MPRDLLTALDRAAARRFPKLFGPSDPLAGLHLAVVFLVVACILVPFGEPYSYGAGAPIGGALGLIRGVLRQARNSERA
jgi:hypothetical protein